MAPPPRPPSRTRSGGRARSDGRSRRPLGGATRARVPQIQIPLDADDAEERAGRHTVQLTNLRKVYWPEQEITKGELLRYYAAVAPVLLPHLADRAMVMKRYPNGIHGKHFFMKRVPSYRPEWLETCAITHGSGNVIHFPVVQDLAAPLWIVNLGVHRPESVVCALRRCRPPGLSALRSRSGA